MVKRRNKGSSNANVNVNGNVGGPRAAAAIVSSSSSALASNGKHVSFEQPERDNGSSVEYLKPSGRGMRPSPSIGTLNRLERQKIVLWKQPILTLKFSALELAHVFVEGVIRLSRHKYKVALSILALSAFYLTYHIPGRHQQLVVYMEKKLWWCLYWIGLGVLSSIGFGTGLHTFLIYLGPHIASVTLAAYECDSLKFPEPPYPDRIICPDVIGPGIGNASMGDSTNAGADTADMMQELAKSTAITLWAIIGKVRLESFMWGAGTALGELPPYFMARAARLSGEEPDDEEYREFRAYIDYIEGGRPQQMTLIDKCKLYVEQIVANVGFLGIIVFASIPNPFFDLAGITCGHFLVSFWTFFGATLVGKAAIKMHVQMLFVVLAFSEHHVDLVVGGLKHVPLVGRYLQKPIKDFLVQQKERLHRRPGDPVETKSNILQELFGLVVVAMVVFFLLSIINSLAQAYHKRLCQKEHGKCVKIH